MILDLTKLAAVVCTALLFWPLALPAEAREPDRASWTEWSRVHTRDSYPDDWHTQHRVEEEIFDGYDGTLMRRWDSSDAGYRLKWYNVYLGPTIGWDCGTIQYVNADRNDNGWVAQWKEATVGGCWT